MMGATSRVYVTSSASAEDVNATWAFAAPWNAKAATSASPAATDVDFDMVFLSLERVNYLP
jgi:hypothetical protein